MNSSPLRLLALSQSQASHPVTFPEDQDAELDELSTEAYARADAPVPVRRYTKLEEDELAANVAADRGVVDADVTAATDHAGDK